MLAVIERFKGAINLLRGDQAKVDDPWQGSAFYYVNSLRPLVDAIAEGFSRECDGAVSTRFVEGNTNGTSGWAEIYLIGGDTIACIDARGECGLMSDVYIYTDLPDKLFSPIAAGYPKVRMHFTARSATR